MKISYLYESHILENGERRTLPNTVTVAEVDMEDTELEAMHEYRPLSASRAHVISRLPFSRTNRDLPVRDVISPGGRK